MASAVIKDQKILGGEPVSRVQQQSVTLIKSLYTYMHKT